MAFGKADSTVIQADRASYGVDPMLQGAAAVGQITQNLLKNQAAAKEQKRKTKAKFNDAYLKGVDDNTGFAHDNARTYVEEFLTGESNTFASADGNPTAQAEILRRSNSQVNSIMRMEGKIKAHREFHNGAQTHALNSDKIDTHFQDQLGAGNYSIRENDNGVIEYGILNPDGYKGETEDGITWFNEDNLPLGSDYNHTGGKDVLSVFSTEVNGRTDGWEGVTPDFTQQYKNKFKDMKMSHFDLKTFIAQDPEGDGIEGNDFYGAFTRGELPSEYYTWGEGDNKTTLDPTNEKALKAFLNNENEDGTRDYNDYGENKNQIIDLFSKYMGEVTKTGYEMKQKSVLENQNRYFNLPGEDGMFMGKGGKAPTADAVKAKRTEVYKDQKFNTVLGDDYDPNTTDFNKLITDDGGPLLDNLLATYETEVENDLLDFDVDDGILTLKVEGGAEKSFNFNEGTKEDKIAMLKLLKNEISTLAPVEGEVQTLGTDATEWDLGMQGNLPFGAVENTRIQVSQMEEVNLNKLESLQGEHGPATYDPDNDQWVFDNGHVMSQGEVERYNIETKTTVTDKEINSEIDKKNKIENAINQAEFTTHGTGTPKI